MTKSTASGNLRNLGLTFHKSGKFYPPVYVNQFWSLTRDYVPINESLTHLPLSFAYSGITYLKWEMQASMEHTLAQQRSWGLQSDTEQDMWKRALMDTSPVLLLTTFVVTVLHTIFDTLAFKNDIQFWRERKSMRGLSTKTMAINVIFHTTIVLYLFDNETSSIILLQQMVALFIELWKLSTTFKLVVIHDSSSVIPRLQLDDSGLHDSETKEYDALAMSYLAEILYPCLGGFTMFSFFYAEHKSIYSWLLSTAVGFIYAAGFIFMTPQLFINYKLQSVAHLPWRKLVYKALSTVIDDLFAFIIEMPTLHRLACFRDDLVFVIFLFQKCLYRVDFARTNEYGLTGEEENELERV